MEKVKRLVEAGADVGGAIKLALPITVSAFADKYSLPRSSTNEAINGVRRATEAQVHALAAELGGSVAEWKQLLADGLIEQAAMAGAST